ncbi:MAG TPA: DUF899 family protein [Candidatus Binatia bacterium]|nr:DUF899 family protein [Candidatus Binatia bacterium]
MTDHKTGTRDQWLAARLDLLKAEKELTRRSDEITRQRQELPWVRIDKPYRFDTDEGSASLADLDVSFTEKQQREDGIAYNCRTIPAETWRSFMQAPQSIPSVLAIACGLDAAAYSRELPGMSAFALEDGGVYHTYSTYERGLDILWGAYHWLDRAPLGRNEPDEWWRRRD